MKKTLLKLKRFLCRHKELYLDMNSNNHHEWILRCVKCKKPD